MSSDSGNKTRVTMKDVARHAGVSQSTVSFVLNEVTDVSIGADTRQRVLEAVEKLNYKRRPQGMARSVSHPIIGFLVDEIATSPFSAITIEGAQEAAWRHGHLLEVAMTGEDAEYEKAILEKWRLQGVVGVIYCSILTRAVTPPEQLAQMRNVLVNCHAEKMPYTAVVPGEVLGGFAATEALLNKGYRRIAFIDGEMWMEAAKDRLTGYRNALTTHGVPIDEALIREGNFLPSGGYKQTLTLLNDGLIFDAIFCANDLTAVGCYEALKERGLRIPDDIAVMGYDDQEIAQHLNPALSTVLLPHREMGQWAVDYLLSPESADTKRVYKLECPLVLRESI
ncbi:LacI family DNA-binding transcriptional regulator [Natronospirillum operosum]|uniref:LacI family DNA-binding transcriptional regulator n=1 Tax=Natronospirillum operosum TaxID=2759953 RepID=A0A4Z0WB01_9GAMM|nr:LacI family DNA-binding transcriptional regulator [Natronospirillum operosum]TGG93535.1 LacI family DNA-binding transcriptional regulator [Natronospirillum operosum]